MEAAEEQAQAAQALFLQRLQYHLPPGIPLMVALADALGLSKSVAYKKVNGESPLSTAQLQHLCNHFECSYHLQGYQHRQEAFVDFTPFYKNNIGVAQYIGGLKKFLTQIARAQPNQLTCATDDIPIFHLFKYPELTAFKLHFWQLRVVDHAPFVLNMNDWSSVLITEAAQLHNIYNQIPSTEIWTSSSLLNTIDQVKHAADSGMITDRGLGRAICQQLRQALADIEGCAINKTKSAEKVIAFDWYFYDIIGSITYLADMNGTIATYIRFNTFNTIHEENGPLSVEVKHWLENLKQDATGFSGQGSLHRNRYLAHAYEACDAMIATFK